MAAEKHCKLELEVQYALDNQSVPGEQDFYSWALAAVKDQGRPVGIVVRVVDEMESRELNNRYRGKNQPTNVLSFPFEVPAGVESDHLGDLVICAPVVVREAQAQKKKEADHWAHMVVHGVLHLCGYDHQTGDQAREMEALEKQILAGLGIKDPYRLTDVAV